MMHYLFLGQNIEQWEMHVALLKKDFLFSLEAMGMDLDILYAAKLDPVELKKSLLALPAVAPQRVVIVHDAHTMNSHNKTLILDHLTSSASNVVLVIESCEWKSDDAYVKKLFPFVKLVELGREAEHVDVFAMTRAMGIRKVAEALKILSQLLEEGHHPLQIMGGIVWFWGKMRGRLIPERFMAGLQALQEADLYIKRSRIGPEYALELLVVKLCTLTAAR
jgi:DNA polymerase III delta subunit